MESPGPNVPTETDPQPVPGHPGWVAWPGFGHRWYAKHPNGINPPVVVRGENWTALLAAIRKAEESR